MCKKNSMNERDLKIYDQWSHSVDFIFRKFSFQRENLDIEEWSWRRFQIHNKNNKDKFESVYSQTWGHVNPIS
jgi:hypothetical protein